VSVEMKFDVTVASIITPDDPSAPDLTTLNGRIHDLLDEWLVGAIEALTALDMASAQRAWNCVVWHIEAHHSAEDELILCHYEDQDIEDYPEGGLPELFQAEHKRLRELMDQCKLELDRIEQAPPHKQRRCMVERLEVFMRVRRLLEHHGLREQTHLYPRLDAKLSREEREFIAEELEAASL